MSPRANVPSDVYNETDVMPTDEYKPFTKKLLVYGHILIGRDDISDDFMRKVAKTIKAIFPKRADMNAALQEEVLRNMHRYNSVIPFFKGEPERIVSEDMERTRSQNSICDIIMQDVPGQVMEVVEHILHYVSDIGLHYTFPDEWGISKTSKLYLAMQEATSKGYYDITQYNDIDEEEARDRVIIQEFAYWLISSAWNLQEPYGPKEAEWKQIKTLSDLQTKLPRAYELYQETAAKIMVAPSLATLEEFVN
jgi:hypothetical protein